MVSDRHRSAAETFMLEGADAASVWELSMFVLVSASCGSCPCVCLSQALCSSGYSACLLKTIEDTGSFQGTLPLCKIMAKSSREVLH